MGLSPASILYGTDGFEKVGQKEMAKSLPVAIASDQSPVPVTFTPPNARTGVAAAYRVLGGGTANTLQVMRSTSYTEPTSAAQRSFASSDANDTAGGTGARAVRLTYFDAAGAGPFTELVALNGLTPVNTVAVDIQFIESMEVVLVGAAGANVGTITLYASTGGGGGAVGSIGVGSVVPATGDNRTLWAHHYVPAGWEASMAVVSASIFSGGAATQGRAFLRVAHPLTANSSEILVGDVLLITGTFERSFTFPPTVDGFARITAYSIPNVNNSTLSSAFDWSERMA